jgi:hypothetical protein
VFAAALTLSLPSPGPAAGVDDAARDRERQARQREEADQANRRAVERFADQVQEVKDELALLQQKTEAFYPRLEALLTSDEGKRVAETPGAFRDFLRIRREPPVSLDEVKSHGRFVDSIADDLAKEVRRQAVGFLPSVERKREVRDERLWVAAKLVKIEEQASALEALLASARKDVDPKTARTLKDVIASNEAKEAEAWRGAQLQGRAQAAGEATRLAVDAARIAALEEAQRRAETLLQETRAQAALDRSRLEAELKKRDAEARERLAQAEREYKDRIAELERKAKDADLERRAQDVAAEGGRRQKANAIDRQVLVQKCRSPEVRTVLAPFLAKGFFQTTQWNLGEVKAEKLPMSLSGLRAAGALNRDQQGLTRLLFIGVVKQHKLDRETKWGFSYSLAELTEQQFETVQAAQSYLIELGDVLVEEGLLAP